MAITRTVLGSGTSNTDGTTFTLTPTTPPTANRLCLLAVVLNDSGGSPAISSVTGAGLTWVEVQTQTMNFDEDLVALYRAMGSFPDATDIVVTVDESVLSCAWGLVQFTEMDTSGTNGSGAIVQSVKAVGSGTNPSTTLSSFGDATNNATYAIAGRTGFETATANGVLVEGYDVAGAFGGESLSLSDGFVVGQDLTPDFTLSNPQVWGTIAVEIKSALTIGPRISNIPTSRMVASTNGSGPRIIITR